MKNENKKRAMARKLAGEIGNMKTTLLLASIMLIGCKEIVLSPEPETIESFEVITDET